MLDVVFREDERLVGKNNGAKNLSMLRKTSNIIKNILTRGVGTTLIAWVKLSH
jgi:hypothetical protein